MVVNIKDIAHYGRWFPFYKRDYDLWWFDKEKCQMIDAEKMGITFDCDVHSLHNVISQCDGNYVACFRVDIPALEMEYARIYLSKEEADYLFKLSPKDMDREFQRIIEQEALVRHWYRYELARLSVAAEQWCKDNHIHYKV